MLVPIYLNIAGLYYHYKPEMPNRMLGYIRAEPNNPHDHNAIGIYSNDYGLIGYIPKEETAFVRAWSHENQPYYNCKIYLDVEPEYNRYFGRILIFDKPDLNSPLSGKSVYLCKNGFSLREVEVVIEGFGAVISGRLSKSTDIVIYEEELTDTVKNKLGVEGYNFSTLTLTEFIQQAIPPEKRIPYIYGCVVTPSSVWEGTFDDYLQSFIIIAGGTYRKTYSKLETETVLIKSDNAAQTITKARNDGKNVVQCEDLMPEMYLTAMGNQPVVNKRSSDCDKSEQRTTILESSDVFHSAPNRSRRAFAEADKENSGTGCLWTLIIAGAVSLYMYFS